MQGYCSRVTYAEYDSRASYDSFNSFAPGRYGINSKSNDIWKHFLQVRLMSISFEFAFRWMPEKPWIISQRCFRQWLSSSWQQANTRANVDHDLCRHMAPLGHNEEFWVVLLWTLPSKACQWLVSQMRVPLAACREPAGTLWQLCKALYVFEQKTQYILIYAPFTHIVVFWHNGNVPPMIS